jgi:hypothetical protein
MGADIIKKVYNQETERLKSEMKVNLTSTNGNLGGDKVHTKVCSIHPDKKIKFFCK